MVDSDGSEETTETACELRIAHIHLVDAVYVLGVVFDFHITQAYRAHELPLQPRLPYRPRSKVLR